MGVRGGAWTSAQPSHEHIQPWVRAGYTRSQRNWRTIAAPERQIAGYNIVSWTDNGVAYWAVSDVAAADLNAFAKAFRAGEPER